MSDSRADRAKAMYSEYKKKLEEREAELGDSLERNRPRVERHHQADEMFEAYNRQLEAKKRSMMTTPEILAENVERAKQKRDDYKNSDESVGFWEMVFKSPTRSDWKESRIKRNQLNDAVDDAQAMFDGYKQQRKMRLTQTLDVDELDNRIAALEKQKEEESAKKPSIFEYFGAALNGDSSGVYDVHAERQAIKKRENDIDAEIAQYRTVRDTKKSQAELEKVPDEVLDLLDKYNDAAMNEKSSRLSDFRKSMNGEQTAYQLTESEQYASKKEAIADELKKKGYDNYGQLAEYRAYLKNAEDAEREAQEAAEFAEAHPVAASVLSTAISPVAAIAGSIGNADSLSKQSDLGYDVNSPYNTFTNYKNQTRDTVASNMESGILSRNTKAFLYQTAMSGADSMLSSALPGGEVLLGMGAMNDTVIDIAKKGGTKSQALLGGLAAGAFETLFEHASISQFKAFKEIPVKNIKTALLNVGKGVLTNFSEEAATEIANITYDYLANGGISDYYQLVQQGIDSGLTESEAKKQAYMSMGKRVMDAGLGGALMGGAFGVTGSAIGAVNYDSQMRQIGQSIAENEGVEKLLAGSADVNADGDSAFSKILNKVTATEDARVKAQQAVQTAEQTEADTESGSEFKYKRSDLRNIGKLSQALIDKTDNESVEIAKSAVKDRLTALGETAENIDKVSAAVVKTFRHESLSSSEKAAVKGSKYAQRVINEYAGN
ncbi:MAG: hypothetical protein NC215_11480, partial [Ruminococcus sp.]|nr:hypothetical protein [Ruminococcus sp.]